MWRHGDIYESIEDLRRRIKRQSSRDELLEVKIESITVG